MRALSEGVAGPWQQSLAERLHETGWVLSHQEDLDADFLAIYGIDLWDCDLTGPRYLALAHRLSAYTGVMATRVQEAEDAASPEPAPQRAAAEPARTQQPAGGGQQEMSLTAFRFQFPGIVSMAQEGGG